MLNFGVMSLLIVAIGAGGLLSAVDLRNQLRDLFEKSIPSMQALTETQSHLWSAMLEDPASESGAKAFADLELSLSEYQRTALHPGAANSARRIRKFIIELQEDLATTPPEELVYRVRELSLFLQTAIEEESQRLEIVKEERGQFFRFSTMFNGALVLVGLLMTLIPGWILASRTSESLRKARTFADAVAEGDLTMRMPERGEDEIAGLAKAFNHMVETIVRADAEISKEVDDRIQAEQRAQAAARAKSDFLAHMSHEFRTPLNGILGYAQVLMMDKGLSAKNQNVVMSLQRSGESLLELINDVLDLSKIEARRMNISQSRFYLRDFLDSIRASYSGQIENKGLGFELEIDRQLPEDILADQIRLRQVLVNLIGNAIKFTDQGKITMRVFQVPDGLSFEVNDTGIGIPEDKIETVLQPFMQVEHKDRSHQGTGLGLPISHRLLQMMGSDGLRIDSTLGVGTTFSFKLPQPDAGQRRMVVSPKKIKGYAGERRRILLVESQQGTSAMLGPLLRKVGFEIFDIRKPEDVVMECSTLHPHLIIMEVRLKGGDGVEIMKEILETFQMGSDIEAPIFLLYSDPETPEDRDRAVQAGASEFLFKPLRFADLTSVLEKLLQIRWTDDQTDMGGSRPAAAPEMERQESKIDNFPVPEAETLEALFKVARTGNVRQLKQDLAVLLSEKPEMRAFCSRLQTLCASYQVNSIMELLKRHLEPTAEKSS